MGHRTQLPGSATLWKDPPPRPLLLLAWTALALLSTRCLAASWATSDGHRYIDCGAGEEEDAIQGGVYALHAGGYGVTYQITGDTYTAAINSSTSPALSDAERTLRVCNSSKCCYLIQLTGPVPINNTNFTVRLGLAYHNYDGKAVPPSFYVSLNGVTVDFVSLDGWEKSAAQGGNPETSPMGGGPDVAHYVEYIFPFPSGTAVVCVLAAGKPLTKPVLNVLEVAPFPTRDSLIALAQLEFGGSVSLALKHRMNLGGPTVVDALNRTWHSESDASDYYSYAAPDGKGLMHINVSTQAAIEDGSMQLPQGMLNTAWQSNTSDASLAVALNFYPLDAVNNPILVRLFCVEFDASSKPGQRNFTAFLDSGNVALSTSDQNLASPVSWVDVVSIASQNGVRGSLTAMFAPLVGCTNTGEKYTTLWLSLVAAPGATLPPILNGVEAWEVVSTGGTALCPFVSLAPNPSPWTSNATTFSVSPYSMQGMSPGAVAGIVLAGLTGLVLLSALIILLRSRSSGPKQTMSFQRFESEVHLADATH